MGAVATLAGPAQLLLAAAEVVLQQLVVGRAALLAPQGVQLDLDVRQTQGRAQIADHHQHLGVQGRILRPQGLQTELVELPALDLPLTAVHEDRAKVVQARRPGLRLQQAVVVAGAHRGSRQVGAQGQFASVFVVEGPQLALDQARRGSHPLEEQVGGFEHRGTDLAISVVFGQVAGHIFQEMPGRDLGRQDVLRPPRATDRHRS